MPEKLNPNKINNEADFKKIEYCGMTFFVKPHKIFDTLKNKKDKSMKTFLFMQKNGSAAITLSAENYEKALEELGEIVTEPLDFRVEDEEGNEE